MSESSAEKLATALVSKHPGLSNEEQKTQVLTSVKNAFNRLEREGKLDAGKALAKTQTDKDRTK